MCYIKQLTVILFETSLKMTYFEESEEEITIISSNSSAALCLRRFLHAASFSHLPCSLIVGWFCWAEHSP